MQRAILPDALSEDAVVLIKACGELRLTYEIRVAVTMANQTGRHLLIVVKDECSLSPTLQAFLRTHAVEVRRRRA